MKVWDFTYLYAIIRGHNHKKEKNDVICNRTFEARTLNVKNVLLSTSTPTLRTTPTFPELRVLPTSR